MCSAIVNLSRFFLLWLCWCAVAGVPGRAGAQGTGTVTGTVTDAETGEPVAYASVVPYGTTLGAMTMSDGSFTIRGVPAGKYELRVLMMGYARSQKAGVEVQPGATTTVDFSIHRDVGFRTRIIVSTADRLAPDVTSSDREQGMTAKKMRDLAAEDLGDVLPLFTGVVDMGDGQVSVRGGRPDEVSTRVDGIPVDNVLGGPKLDVSLFGTETYEMLSGGMDAEHGEAQSAIVNITTKEGGSQFAGEFQYWTDDFGRQDATYTNYDRICLGFGGPSPVDRLRYYVSGEASFTDTENLTGEPRKEHKITDWLKFRDRLTRSYNLQTKLSYGAGEIKVTGEVILGRSRQELYINNWNVKGYVSKVYYFQRLEPLAPPGSGSPGVYGFAGITVVPHGKWATDPSSLRPWPVVVVRRARNPETGENEEIRYESFRAVELNGTTVLWDEVLSGTPESPLSTRSWVLFEGFQAPYSRFSHFPDDSSFVAFNSATRTPEATTDQLHLKMVFSHNLATKLLYQVKISRLELNTRQTVDGKAPHQFESAGLPVTLPSGIYLEGGLTNANWYTDPDLPYVVTAYDYPFFADQRIVQYIAQTSLVSEQLKGHRLKTGFQFVYNDLNGDERINPAQRRLNEAAGTVQQGLNVNLFHNFNTEGAFYVQDKWEFEGMVANGGVRIDYFSTGNNNEVLIENEDIDQSVERYKYSVSPRLGFAFPITDRDKFFFHYGRFTQWPQRSYLFRTQDPIGAMGTLGNPNLEPELTVSYQAGIAHQFTNDVVGNFVVFNKDIYGLVTSTPVTDESTGIRTLRYVNRAYASSRGLEVSLEKRLSRRLGLDVAYTYSFADGVASDADFGRSAEGLTHLPTDELPLDWDRRHTLSASARLKGGRDWVASATYIYGSGLPWTPYDRFARLQDPLWENSRRLEPIHQLSVRGQKIFDALGNRLTVYFEGRNLLNQDILRQDGTRPSAYPAMTFGSMDDGAYLTETGRYGGAYLRDLDDDGRDEFTPVHDPAIWQQHRVWRVGLGLEF